MSVTVNVSEEDVSVRQLGMRARGYKQRRGVKLGWGGSAEGTVTPVVASMTQLQKAE